MLETTGIKNVAVGGTALQNVSGGSENVGIGHSTAITLTMGSNNICIGCGSIAGGTVVDVPTATTSNYLNIGNVIKGDMATPGSITVSADPVIPLGIATKQYVDTAVAGAAGAPADPVNSMQFNNAGAFGGSANLTWDNTNNIFFYWYSWNLESYFNEYHGC
jgi:hypothetical protein